MATATAIRAAFAAHRPQIIGAARRAPRGESIWALVRESGKWEGISGPFGQGSSPAILHNSSDLYSLRFSASPFLSRDEFDDALLVAFDQWLGAEADADQF